MKRVGRRLDSAVALALCVAAAAGCGATNPSPFPAAPTGSAPVSIEPMPSPQTSSAPALTPPPGGATSSPLPTDAAGTPAVSPSLTGALACEGTDVTFPADVFSQPPNAELAASAPAVALRQLLGTGQAAELGFPLRGWRVAIESADSVTFVAPGPSAWAIATITSTPDAGWQFFEGGKCALRVGLPEGIGFATWRLDPAVTPGVTADSVSVLALETACASGRSPEGRLLPPIVLYSADAVTIAITVRKRPGDQDCQGNPEVPIVVQLAEPLGSRHLFDGSSFPTVQRD